MSKDMNEYNADEWLEEDESPQDKFSPKTHQTRCGKPWRLLDINTPEGAWIAVGEEYETPVYLDDKGDALSVDNFQRTVDCYDLIPIQQANIPPVDLPTNLRPSIKLAAMNKCGFWVGTIANTLLIGNALEWWSGHSDCDISLECIDIPKDPAGWENSLHKRVGDLWERVLV